MEEFIILTQEITGKRKEKSFFQEISGFYKKSVVFATNLQELYSTKFTGNHVKVTIFVNNKPSYKLNFKFILILILVPLNIKVKNITDTE